MSPWVWVPLLVLGVFAVSFGLGVLVGRMADMRDDPSGPRVRVERRTR